MLPVRELVSHSIHNKEELATATMQPWGNELFLTQMF